MHFVLFSRVLPHLLHDASRDIGTVQVLASYHPIAAAQHQLQPNTQRQRQTALPSTNRPGIITLRDRIILFVANRWC